MFVIACERGNVLAYVFSSRRRPLTGEGMFDRINGFLNVQFLAMYRCSHGCNRLEPWAHRYNRRLIVFDLVFLRFVNGEGSGI